MMDERWQLTDTPRELTSGVTAETPLVTIAWRVQRVEHKRRAEERRAQEREAQRAAEVLVQIAEQAHRLRQIARALQAAPDAAAGPANQGQQLAAIAERLHEALRAADVSVIAPEGEPFTAELMDLFENIAQQPAAGLTEPRIAEVIKPAVTRGDALLRMGKAVIAIPPPAAAAAATDDAAPAAQVDDMPADTQASVQTEASAEATQQEQSTAAELA
jgi:molecular chaperone GrpE (heat shock protein)